MPRKDVEPNRLAAAPESATPESAEESTAQDVYFLPEVGRRFRQGQVVTYEVATDEAGRRYAFNVQIVDEPSVH